MKQTLRTFVAVEIDKSIRSRVAELIERLRGVRADVKWVETHNLHLTMKFLGDVPEREIAQVCRAVQRTASAREPFDLELRGTGAFPNAGSPRTVWLGSRDGAEQMAILHDSIEAVLAELGYPKEDRRFQTHVTIGRVRGGGPGLAELAALLKQYADFAAGRMTVSKVTVFSSTLTASGPIYEVMDVATLGQ